jgi:hypothetical protein
MNFVSNYNILWLQTTSATNLTTAGQKLGYLYINATGTINILDNLECISTFLLNKGILNNSYNITTPSFIVQSSSLKTLNMGNGIYTINGSTFSISGSNLTFDSGKSTIILSDNSATNKTFVGGNKIFYNLSITGGGTGTVTIAGSNTFNILTINKPKTVIFTKTTTQTVTSFVAIGDASNIITILTNTAGSKATLSQISGTVNCEYLSLKDSEALGGATWSAGYYSTNVSGNSGWTFLSFPTLKGFDGDNTITFAMEYPATSKLRFGKDNTVFGITLVDTDDANASKFRIYDGITVKALKKL